MSRRALIQYLELIKQSGIRELYRPQSNNAKLLEELSSRYSDCHKCPLADGRIKLVYGEGNHDADIMLIGEGPGEQENLSGRPFVGAAGQLLDKMLAAINIRREEIYIANIVKCRPPGNRNPNAEERLACMPYLIEQIGIIRPKVLLIMGLVAAQSLLSDNETLGWHREKTHDFMGIPAYVTYHPAALLRNDNWKRPAWEDLQRFQKDYEQMR
ncbi:MAG: uracil-DNA glycosylase [Candidatus Cloacimonetes bacterium]|nr:uracil-DNA glycosylase [Candidatus Cloacimonadota bacterium]HOH60427.1 uracil-DNA glycosylase [Candidatus Cloacimonadota bacterium]